MTQCLSLWEPWAVLIRDGLKSIETRSWPISYRGTLGIHAAKRWNRELADLCEIWPFVDVLPSGDLPKGCVIAVAELYDCRRVSPELEAYCRRRTFDADMANTPCEYHFGDFSQGRWMWFLRDVRPIQPVSIPGRQGLFDVDLEREEVLA